MEYVQKIGNVTATIVIPDRTPEEQKKRNEELKEGWLCLYRKMESEGRGHLLTGKNKTDTN